MSVRIRLPTALRSQTGGVTQLEVPAHTVSEALRSLEERMPQLEGYLRDSNGDLRPAVSIYVNDEHIRYRQGLDTPLQEDDEVYIVPLVMGG
jgi:molybdopterin synthase sulfur carrier subunit